MIQTNNLQPTNWATPAQPNLSQSFGRSMLPGRMISGLNDMRPQDVPMDGTPAFFPQNDGKYIYVKLFDENCNLKTFRYVVDTEPIKEPIPEKPTDPMLLMQSLVDKLDNMQKQIDELNQNKSTSKSDAKSYYGSKEE